MLIEFNDAEYSIIDDYAKQTKAETIQEAILCAVKESMPTTRTVHIDCTKGNTFTGRIKND